MMIILRMLFPLFVLTMLLSCHQTETNTTQNKETKKNNETGTEQQSKAVIVFLGNSLTAGYGLDSQQEAFPAIIQAKIDSMGMDYRCVNAGLSGETSAGGKERIDWILNQQVDIFVLELGANDGLRGISPQSTYHNLSAIVEKVIKAYPQCKLVLAGMKIPPSMGQEYFKAFEALYPKLAKEYHMHLIPFLLEDVAGIADLNQADGIHPTVEGQKIIAENVWKILKPML